MDRKLKNAIEELLRWQRENQGVLDGEGLCPECEEEVNVESYDAAEMARLDELITKIRDLTA